MGTSITLIDSKNLEKAQQGVKLLKGVAIALPLIVLALLAAATFYDTLVHYLRLGLRAIAAIALLVAAGGFLTRPSRAAGGVRRWFGSAMGCFQGGTGVGATPVGLSVGRNKRPLRVGAILLPVIIFTLWSAPSVTVLIVLIVLALLLLLAIELVGRAPPSPAKLGTPTSAA